MMASGAGVAQCALRGAFCLRLLNLSGRLHAFDGEEEVGSGLHRLAHFICPSFRSALYAGIAHIRPRVIG